MTLAQNWCHTNLPASLHEQRSSWLNKLKFLNCFKASSGKKKPQQFNQDVSNVGVAGSIPQHPKTLRKYP